MEYVALNYIYRREKDGRPMLDAHLEMPLDILIPMLIDNQESTREEIAVSYGFSMAQIYAALAFYYDHTEEFEARWAEAERLAEPYRAESDARRARMEARMAEIKRQQGD